MTSVNQKNSKTPKSVQSPKTWQKSGKFDGSFFLLMLNHLKNLFTNVDAKCMSSIQGAF